MQGGLRTICFATALAVGIFAAHGVEIPVGYEATDS
jgi:hypothetical protein